MLTGPSDTSIADKAIRLCECLLGSEKRVAAAIIDNFNCEAGQCDRGVASEVGERPDSLGLVD